MTYLARLKALNLETHCLPEPSKPSKAPFEPFEGDEPPCSLELDAPAEDTLAERAAIIQEGAGVPADWAHGLASPSWEGHQ